MRERMLDDQDWFADTEAELVAQGSPPEPESPSPEPESLSLQTESSPETEPSPTEPEAVEPEAAQPVEASVDEEVVTAPEEAVADDDTELLRTQVAELEKQIQARNDEEAAKKRETEEQMRQMYAQQINQQDAEMVKRLGEVDEDLAQKYQQRIGWSHQQEQQFRMEAATNMSALEALTLALEHQHPDLMTSVTSEAKELLKYPTMEHKRSFLEAKYKPQREADALRAEYEKKFAEMQAKLEAQSRPPEADAVDGGSPVRPSSPISPWSDPNTTFDQAFDDWVTTLPFGQAG